MNCYQCQETMGGKGCRREGVCGKKADVAALQDLLVWTAGGLGALTTQLRKEKKEVPQAANRIFREALYVTMTNTNFDPAAIKDRISEVQSCCRELFPQIEKQELLPEASSWNGEADVYAEKAREAEPLPVEEEDIRSFRAFLTCSVKGIASMLVLAADLSEEDPDADIFIQRALAQTLDDSLREGNLLAVVMESGRYCVRAMDLLNRARVNAFGTPERTEIHVHAGSHPGILVTGSNMQDLFLLLEQTKDAGIDIYTHGELLCAGAYPKLKAYPHFAGHYGGSWQTQKEDFDRFHGPVLATSDGIFLPRSSYRNRLYTTGCTGLPGCMHIPSGGTGKDFSVLIDQAKTCPAPETPGKTVTYVTGFGHAELFRQTERIAEALREGSISKIAVVAGDDGRVKKRAYYSDLIKALPEDVLVLTAGSVQFRLPEKDGELSGMPRLAGAGSLEDLYSVIQFALRLREVMGVDSLNQLPVFYSVSWHGQKAVSALLALLYLDIKQVYLGPTRPAFFSENVWAVFSGYFGLHEISTVQKDLEAVLGTSGNLIREDMIVGDIVDQYPSLIPVMAEHGLHCIGCGVSKMETLAEACITHGLNVYDLMEDLNNELKQASAGKA